MLAFACAVGAAELVETPEPVIPSVWAAEPVETPEPVIRSVGADEPVEKPKPIIQMAILLDTSGSMSGLIEQAKTQLWKIVNEMVLATRDGQVPDLQLALYEYGKSSIPADEGYMRMILPLTTDLDKVSEELFALRTNGGSEYCGMVIKAATEGLAWSESEADLKVIFIAGNEPFTQGNVDYKQACKDAIARGIVVNTIHCGSYDQGVAGHWKDGALLADGTYMNIDQNRKVVHIDAPQDKDIMRLNEELNKTYIAYGREGAEGAANQVAQDANAMKYAEAGASVQRAAAKASAQYSNARWDMVDALRDGKVDLEEMEAEDLPENMREMSPEERTEYVEAQAARRAEIQQEIGKLNAERKTYVADQRKKVSAEGEEDTLDAAMVKSLRAQAEKKEFKFE